MVFKMTHLACKECIDCIKRKALCYCEITAHRNVLQAELYHQVRTGLSASLSC